MRLVVYPVFILYFTEDDFVEKCFHKRCVQQKYIKREEGVVDNIGGLSIEEGERVSKLLHTMQRYCLNNILFLVPGSFFKFTLKMDMSWFT